jgi:mannosyltransferase OCH1-like enzyme
MELQHPLDELFTQHHGVYLVTSSNIGSCITNSFMASIPGHPLWLDCIEEMKKSLPSWCIGKHWKVMRSTGPMMIDNVVKKNKYNYIAIPNSLILPCSVCNDQCEETKQSYIKPLQGQSWIGWDTSIYNFFMCNWKTIAIILFIIFLILLILVIYFIFFK